MYFTTAANEHARRSRMNKRTARPASFTGAVRPGAGISMLYKPNLWTIWKIAEAMVMTREQLQDHYVIVLQVKSHVSRTREVEMWAIFE